METIGQLVDAIIETKYQGGTVMVCGNGGLAACGEHFAAELTGKFAFDIYIPAISLTSNTSLVTAIANDMGYENLFAHQVEVYGKKNDLLIAMTTSRSLNVIKALLVAKLRGIKSCAIGGDLSGEMGAFLCIVASGDTTAEIQENIMRVLHKVAWNVKERLYKECLKTRES